MTDWLSGQTIAHAGRMWPCWDGDPFPDDLGGAEVDESSRPKRNRYYHYRAIACKLKVSGFDNRVKLPCCVMKNIAERYPDTKPKVGFKRSRFDFEPVSDTPRSE